MLIFVDYLKINYKSIDSFKDKRWRQLGVFKLHLLIGSSSSLNPLLKMWTLFCEDSKRPASVCIHRYFMSPAVEPWSWFMSLLHWSHGLLSFRAMSHLINRPVALWQTPSVRISTSEWPHPLLISSSIIPIESCQVSCRPRLPSTRWPTDSPIR